MAIRYVIGLRNLDGVPTTTRGVTVSGVVPTTTTALEAKKLAREGFLARGYEVPNLAALGVVSVRVDNGDVELGPEDATTTTTYTMGHGLTTTDQDRGNVPIPRGVQEGRN
jgi:hypothetical protein